jgi:peptidyl-prolyl cis-trans isomerase A (cyclophilin A)
VLISLVLGLSLVYAIAPANFIATFDTTVGTFNLNVTRAYAPLGVDRFYELILANYYDGNGLFRVITGFVVQWGINGDPTVTSKWVNATILDDPVLISNVAGTIAFATAGPDTRTTQLFINYVDNSFLDSQGFAPFGTVSDLTVPNGIYSGYGEQPDQDLITSEGNAYLQANFPSLSYINTVRIM